MTDANARTLDDLLDAFQSDSLTPGDIHALSGLLREIIDGEIGHKTHAGGRTIQAGDKIAATIVLRSMEQLLETMGLERKRPR